MLWDEAFENTLKIYCDSNKDDFNSEKVIDLIMSEKINIVSMVPTTNYISGNSLPVRHLDIIMNKSNKINFVGNRGLSGIDSIP